jgi:hypothetical protein
MSGLQELADRLAQGVSLELADAPAIVGTPDLIAVGVLADEVRRQLHGVRTTFVRVLEVHVEAIPAALPPGANAGELRLVGPPSSATQALEAVASARKLSGGGIPLSGFSLADLAALEPSSSDLFASLAREGLEAVADLPVDGPGDTGATVTRARAAGLRVERMTVHGAAADPLSTVAAAIELQRTVGGFRTFAPLPRTLSTMAPTTGYEDVKAVVLARLLTRDIPSVQVDWPLYGPKLAQVALTVGADDVDGVAAVDSGTLGARRSALEEITRNIRAAGLEPVERNGRHEVVGEPPLSGRP